MLYYPCRYQPYRHYSFLLFRLVFSRGVHLLFSPHPKPQLEKYCKLKPNKPTNILGAQRIIYCKPRMEYRRFWVEELRRSETKQAQLNCSTSLIFTCLQSKCALSKSQGVAFSEVQAKFGVKNGKYIGFLLLRTSLGLIKHQDTEVFAFKSNSTS